MQLPEPDRDQEVARRPDLEVRDPDDDLAPAHAGRR